MMMNKLLNKTAKIEIIKYLASAVAVMLIGTTIILLQGGNPMAAFTAILQGSLGDIDGIAQTIRWMTPCILAGIAAVVAFKSGVMNLGIEGQIYVGAFAAAVIGYAVALP
ncbi:MAG: ABC transporter permease, partial [Angelakisella sp.]